MKKEIIGICVLIALFVAFVGAFSYMDTIIGENVPVAATLIEVTPIVENGIVILENQRVSGFSCDIKILHDNKRNVTCWKIAGGLSCIPDHLLEEEEGP